MASKRKKSGAPRDEIRATAEYYKLHTDAVNDLVYADESNSPEVPEAELRKYRSGSRLRLADWAKAILIKMWFAGSVCFFIFWGLSGYITARLDLLLVFGLTLGAVTDLLTNNVLRYFAKTPAANDRWMMFPQKGYATLLFNMLYAVLLLGCVAVLYNLINLALLALAGGGPVVLGVEPVLFGVFYTLFDLLFLSIRRTVRQIVEDAKKQVKGNHS